MDGHHVEPIIQVFAKAVASATSSQVPIARGDHPRVDKERLRVADPLEFALLQHAQQLDLQLGRGGIDLVEKNGAGVGRLERPVRLAIAPVKLPRTWPKSRSPASFR